MLTCLSICSACAMRMLHVQRTRIVCYARLSTIKSSKAEHDQPHVDHFYAESFLVAAHHFICACVNSLTTITNEVISDLLKITLWKHDLHERSKVVFTSHYRSPSPSRVARAARDVKSECCSPTKLKLKDPVTGADITLAIGHSTGSANIEPTEEEPEFSLAAIMGYIDEEEDSIASQVPEWVTWANLKVLTSVVEAIVCQHAFTYFPTVHRSVHALVVVVHVARVIVMCLLH